jgi:hypothetical protein
VPDCLNFTLVKSTLRLFTHEATSGGSTFFTSRASDFSFFSSSVNKMDIDEVSAVVYLKSRLRRKKKRFWIHPILRERITSLKMAVFWAVALCNLEEFRRFRGACYLHHQGDESSPG